MGDINWDDFTTTKAFDRDFIDVLQDNFLIQTVNLPTRLRGQDTPHILDLVISNDDIVNNIEYLSPLGKSDHLILQVMLNSTINNDSTDLKLNFAKGRYDDFRKYLNINWNELFLQNAEDVEFMWSTFK